MTFINLVFDKETLKKFSTQTIIAGVLMLLVGAVGMFAPSVMSFVVVTFLGWLFMLSAVIQGYIVYKTYRKSFSAWLKPVLSLITALLFFFFPIEGIAAVAMLLAAYLLVDAYSSFGFAMDYKPNSGWLLLIVNALLSILLAVLIVMGWPASSLFWVGLFAAVSLFFDGVALVAMGLGARKLVKEDEKK
jgi:uncharacterized membrane protein HdeD (DUF308 family)